MFGGNNLFGSGPYGARPLGSPYGAVPFVTSNPNGNRYPRHTIRMFGWVLSVLGIASMTIAVANTTYTYANYQASVATCTSATTIVICPIVFSYISSGIWGSVTVFFAGVIAIKASQNPYRLLSILKFLCMISSLLFTPAMVVLSALEIKLWTENTPALITFTASTVSGDITKFALTLTVAVLAALEFIIVSIATIYFMTNNQDWKVDGAERGSYSPYGSRSYVEGTLPPIYLPSDDIVTSKRDDPVASPSSPNYNNNNVIVPPVVMQAPQAAPAPAPAPSPYPIYVPQPIIVNASSDDRSMPPQPVFLPVPPQRRIAPRPILRPYPPSRYYPFQGQPPVRRYPGPNYLYDQVSPFVGRAGPMRY